MPSCHGLVLSCLLLSVVWGQECASYDKTFSIDLSMISLQITIDLPASATPVPVQLIKYDAIANAVTADLVVQVDGATALGLTSTGQYEQGFSFQVNPWASPPPTTPTSPTSPTAAPTAASGNPTTAGIASAAPGRGGHGLLYLCAALVLVPLGLMTHPASRSVRTAVLVVVASVAVMSAVSAVCSPPAVRVSIPDSAVERFVVHITGGGVLECPTGYDTAPHPAGGSVCVKWASVFTKVAHPADLPANDVRCDAVFKDTYEVRGWGYFFSFDGGAFISANEWWGPFQHGHSFQNVLPGEISFVALNVGQADIDSYYGLKLVPVVSHLADGTKCMAAYKCESGSCLVDLSNAADDSLCYSYNDTMVNQTATPGPSCVDSIENQQQCRCTEVACLAYCPDFVCATDAVCPPSDSACTRQCYCHGQVYDGECLGGVASAGVRGSPLLLLPALVVSVFVSL